MSSSAPAFFSKKKCNSSHSFSLQVAKPTASSQISFGKYTAIVLNNQNYSVQFLCRYLMTLYVCIQMIIDSQGSKMYLEHTIGLVKEIIQQLPKTTICLQDDKWVHCQKALAQW